MKVLRLYIKNCGVFKNHLIDFTKEGAPQELLCLSGANGSGKTTVMELIYNLIMFINPELSINEIHFDRLKPHILTRVDFTQLDILIDNNILSIIIGDEEQIQHDQNRGQCYIIIDNEIKQIIRTFENFIVKEPEDDSKIAAIRKKNSLEEIMPKVLNIEKKIKIKNRGLFKQLFDKISTATSDSTNPSELTNIPSLFLFNAHDREILDIRYSSIPKDNIEYRLSHRYHPKDDDINKLLVYYEYAYRDQFDDLKSWLNNNVLDNKCLEKIDRPNFKVIIKTKDNSEHGLELLSSGEESLLIISIQLYLKASPNSIILIDEIDQSLHPEYQQKIIKVIKKLQEDKKCQVIVSSHSRFIWNEFEEAARIRLESGV